MAGLYHRTWTGITEHEQRFELRTESTNKPGSRVKIVKMASSKAESLASLCAEISFRLPPPAIFLDASVISTYPISVDDVLRIAARGTQVCAKVDSCIRLLDGFLPIVLCLFLDCVLRDGDAHDIR